MRRTQKILSVILAILMVLSIVPITASAAVTSGTCGDNLIWTYNTTTFTLTISGTGDMKDYGMSNRPWESYEDKIKTVIISDGVTSIGKYAFYSLGSVTSISIPESVTKLGDRVFNACKLLTTVTLPQGLTTIPTSTFTNCSGLTSITIPENVTSIGLSAFEGCSSLTSITIPDGVTSIGDKAFASCKKLEGITIPANLTTISNSAFDGCTSLANITVDVDNPNFSSDESGVLFNKNKSELIKYPMGSTATSYTIPESVTTIASAAFAGCAALESVTIPDSVTKISKGMFENCVNLATVTIPESVITIEANAFNGTALYNNAENWENNILYIGDYLIVADTSISGDVQIKDGTKIIAEEAFFCYSNVTSITIPSSVTTINNKAFYGCHGLTSIVIPNNITTIGAETFAYCSKLTNITIPVSVKTIEKGAFEGCASLKEVYYSGRAADWFRISVGDNNEAILKADVLSGPGGEMIVIPGDTPSSMTWEFDEATGVLKIVGRGAMENFKSDTRPWQSHRLAIKEVIIDGGITTIGDYAFYECSNLTSVTLPSALTTIGKSAFDGCLSLTDITLPDSVSTIGAYAFDRCMKITSINLEDVKTIGSYAFYNCVGLTNLIIGDDTTVIGNAAFCGCQNLKSVSIGKNVTAIGNNAFEECYAMTSFTVDSDNPNYSSDEHGVLFNKDKTALVLYPIGNSRTSYTMPDSVTTIKSKSFDDCKNLITLTFSKNLRTIEENVFSSCSVKEYYYPCTVEQWNDVVTVGDQNNMLSSKTLHFSPTDFEAVTGKCGENLIWTLNAYTGEMVISGTGEMYDYEYNERRSWEDYTSVIKTVVFADGVTTVGSDAFSYCTRITSVTFSNTVTSIGDYAFYDCISIESITIPDSVATIGIAAYNGCENVVEISIGKGLTSFAANTFLYLEKLERINVDTENPNFSSSEDGVLFNKDKTTIVKYPEGHSRANYTIPDSVTTIGVYAFHGCENLTQIIIPDGVTTLELGAFSMCTCIETVVLPDTVTTIGDRAFSYCSNLTEVVIPNSVTTIGKEAFEYSVKLESVTIPDGVTTIGIQTFSYCEKLTEVVIPENVTTIGKDAFFECVALSNVYFKGTRAQWSNIAVADYNESLYDATIYFNYGSGEFLYTVISEEEKTIKVTDYNISAPSLKVIIPKTIDGYTVVEIDDKAFYNIDTLLSVNIPDTVTRIGAEAFYGCDSLTEIAIPESVLLIEKNAFASCKNLAKMELGKGIEMIDNGAFNKCTALKDIHYTGTEKNWNSITIGENNQPLFDATKHFEYSELESVSGTCGENLTWTLDFYSGRLTVSGAGDMEEYGYQKFPWENYKGSIREVVISEGVTTIGVQAFHSCTNLKTVTIAGSVTTIGKSAFYNCSDLESVTISDGVKIIGNSAFYNCQSLESVIIPDSVTTIEDSVFYNCKSLTTVKLSKNITEISHCVFYGCNKLKAITIPDGVTSIGGEAFYTCVSLTEITIPESVTKIYDDAFAYCKGLTTITIGSGVTQIGWSAFDYCISLTDVYYTGSPSQWKMILILPSNNELLNATLHCLAEEHPHEFVIVVTEPGCLTRGYTTYTCECGYTYTDNYVDVLEHDFENIVTNPTCTEEGYTTCTCTRCGYSYIGAYLIDPIGHTYLSEITTPPTHMTEGIETFICKDCGDTYTEKVEKTDNHTYESVITAPTCTEQGYTTYICACGDSYVDDYVPVTGHTVEQFESVTISPTCINNGSKEVVSCCAVCNVGLGNEIVTIPAHGHISADAVEENYIAPTCTENGSKDVVICCSACDEEISRETITLEAKGHTDNDGDGYCDINNELLNPSVECDHNCHKGGISGFFWKITLFFSRIFGTNKVCECGATHY